VLEVGSDQQKVLSYSANYAILTGSSARSATRRYLSYSEADFKFFFSQQRRRVAPMEEKFGKEERTSVPNFTPIRATTMV